VYDRTFDGKAVNFGVIGVDRGSLTIYDDETKSWWSQLFGEALSGEMKGKKLTKLPSTMTTWSKWKELHPDTTVYIKRSIPYNARFTAETFQNFASMPAGPPQPTEVVLGVEGHVQAKAYLLRRLAKNRVRNDKLEDAPILVFLSEDHATSRVYPRTVDGRELTFDLAGGDLLKDRETGSAWNAITGKAVFGDMKGKSLEPLTTSYALWAVWHRYREDTELAEE